MKTQEIARRILEARRARGMTQLELARRLSVTNKAVSKWERGAGLPDISLLLPLCRVLGLTLGELLAEEDAQLLGLLIGCMPPETESYRSKGDKKMVWSAEKAKQWYEKTPMQFGFNYVPSTAVNSTEMWQDADFDEATIRRELGWAAEQGFNSARVFLPFLVWDREGETFLRNFERFLSIAAENGISVLPILFDDCAFDKGEDPYPGKQKEPMPGLHNGRWTPSPGFRIADDPARQPRLREYVHSVVGAHREDPRIIGWDVFNEPGNTQRGNLSLPLLVQAMRWCREMEPVQPLSAGVWQSYGKPDSVFLACLELSDVINFHCYSGIAEVRRVVEMLRGYDRPLFLTEWLCRQQGSNYEEVLPFLVEEKISCWQWGLVRGKTQTNLHWGVLDPEPPVWQHDLLEPDGSPRYPHEPELIKKALEQAK